MGSRLLKKFIFIFLSNIIISNLKNKSIISRFKILKISVNLIGKDFAIYHDV